MRENRTCGSEGGEGVSPSRPLSKGAAINPALTQPFDTLAGSISPPAMQELAGLMGVNAPAGASGSLLPDL